MRAHFTRMQINIGSGTMESQVLQQKSLGYSIMISDFIVEGYGYLCDDQDKARKSLETQKDGYFNSL